MSGAASVKPLWRGHDAQSDQNTALNESFFGNFFLHNFASPVTTEVSFIKTVTFSTRSLILEELFKKLSVLLMYLFNISYLSPQLFTQKPLLFQKNMPSFYTSLQTPRRLNSNDFHWTVREAFTHMSAHTGSIFFQAHKVQNKARLE